MLIPLRARRWCRHESVRATAPDTRRTQRGAPIGLHAGGAVPAASRGRWCPTTASGYVRTASEIILRIQSTVAGRIRKDVAHAEGELLGETAAYLDTRKELTRRGYAEVNIEAEKAKLLTESKQTSCSGYVYSFFQKRKGSELPK